MISEAAFLDSHTPVPGGEKGHTGLWLSDFKWNFNSVHSGIFHETNTHNPQTVLFLKEKKTNLHTLNINQKSKQTCITSSSGKFRFSEVGNSGQSKSLLLVTVPPAWGGAAPESRELPAAKLAWDYFRMQSPVCVLLPVLLDSRTSYFFL